MNIFLVLGGVALAGIAVGCAPSEADGHPDSTPEPEAPAAGVMSAPPPSADAADKADEDDPGGAGTGLPIGGVEKKGS